MNANMAETIKVIADGGGLVVLVFVLAGLGYMAIKAVPAAVAFMTSLTSKLGEISTKQAVIDTKVDTLTTSTAAMSAAIVRLGEISQGAIAKAGDSTAAALGKLGDAVQAEGVEIRESVFAAEARVTKAIRREQASEPPGPASRPTYTPAITPSTGLPRTARAGDRQ